MHSLWRWRNFSNQEEASTNDPKSPYGNTKLIGEQILMIALMPLVNSSQLFLGILTYWSTSKWEYRRVSIRNSSKFNSIFNSNGYW